MNHAWAQYVSAVCLCLQDLAVQHEVQAYLAHPRLVSHQSFPTTIVYDAENHNVTAWERLWKPFSGRRHSRLLLQDS